MWYCSVPSSRPQRYLSPIPLKSCPWGERNSKSYFKKPGWDFHLRDSGAVRSNDHIDCSVNVGQKATAVTQGVFVICK